MASSQNNGVLSWDKQRETSKKKCLFSIELISTSEQLHSAYRVSSLIITEDNHIVSGGGDGSITISLFDFHTKIFTIYIHKPKAHNGSIHSLCPLPNKRLLSVGGNDFSIKVWFISSTSISLISTLFMHFSYVNVVTALTEHRFISSAEDATMNIWQGISEYKHVVTLRPNGSVRAILQLKRKELLVTCGYASSIGISLWCLREYTHKHSILGYGVRYSSHMVELYNGNVALSTINEGYPIVIVDCDVWEVVTVIQLDGVITNSSSLCLVHQHSLVYVYDGVLVEICSDDWTVEVNVEEEGFYGYKGVILIKENNRKYLVIQHYNCVAIVQVVYNDIMNVHYDINSITCI